VAAPIGVDALGAEVSLFDLPGPGLALAGPGAEPAARAILAATLSTSILEHLLDRPVLVTTVGTLARLLPAGTPPVGLNPDGSSFDGERLIILDDPGSAVTHAEGEMIGRRRLLDSMGADTVAALNARADHFEQQPPYLLLLEADERHASRIRAVATHRQALHLHWVILGPLDGISTVEVNADGTVTAAPVPGTADAEVPALARLATLAAADLVDVLALVAEVAPRAEEGVDLDDPFEPAEPVQPGDVGAPDVEIPTRSADSPAPVRLTVLGPPSLATQHGPVTSGVRSGSLAVLAVLAAHPHGRTYEEMAAVLHPTADADTGVNRVHTDLNAVRSLLKKATGTDGKGKFIVHDGASGRYRIDPNMIEVDLWRMLAAIQRANAAEDEADCLAALREAADCYRGDFATGHDGAWTLDYATTYRYQILGAYARIAEILEADQPDQAIAALEQAIEYDPVNEELYQRLIRIQGRLGRPDGVRRTLRLLEDRLADLGEAEVSEATRRVAARQLKPSMTRRS
jgi:DNA-binding SARP family transcriptional activator